MTAETVSVAAAEGGAFDCYLALPEAGAPAAPAVVIMASVYGVDADVEKYCRDLAARGFPAAAPDLFWRGDKGPKPRTEQGGKEAAARAKDRAPMIQHGMKDLADVIARLQQEPSCDGRVTVVGLCYGGPFAILGPAQLGCAAGFSFHGTKVQEYLDPLPGVTVPLSFHWGDQDHAAPAEALETIGGIVADMPNAELTVYPGAGHGYTSTEGPHWDAEVTAASWARTFEILDGLRAEGAAAAE